MRGWVQSGLLLLTVAMGPEGMAARGQAGAESKVLTYDVVSVKPNTSGTNGTSFRMSVDGYMATNVTLHMLLANAYGFTPDRISGGPKWSDSDHFDVKAKVAEGDLEALKRLSGKERLQMLAAAVEERFKVKVHRETKELPVYDLVVAKGGPKLKEAAPGDAYPNGMKGPDGAGHGGMMRMGRGNITAQGIQIKGMLGILEMTVQRSVIDKTGLKGNYDFELKWTPDDSPAGATTAEETGPSIFTALEEQLGLRLNASRGPVETLIVDYAEKPSED